MRWHNLFHRKMALIFLGLVSTSGCAATEEKSELLYSVSWSSGYQMVALLSKTVAINDQKDLQEVLDAPWYAEISVVNTKSSAEISFTNCSDYLSEVTENTHA